MAVAADGVTLAGLRAALSGWLDPVAMPRRIRILHALPREETGKLVHERLLELFRDDERPPTRTMEPFEERSSAGDGAGVRVLSFLVPPDLLYFRGHFDGDPVLPAVVQLDGLVLRQIESNLAGARRPPASAPAQVQASRQARGAPGAAAPAWTHPGPR